MTNSIPTTPDSSSPPNGERSCIVGLVALFGLISLYDLVCTRVVLGSIPLNELPWLYMLAFVAMFLGVTLGPKPKEPEPSELSVRSLRIFAVAFTIIAAALPVCVAIDVMRHVQTGPVPDEPEAMHTLQLLRKLGFGLWAFAFMTLNVLMFRQLARHKEWWLKSGRPMPEKRRLWSRFYPELARFASEDESLRNLRQVTKMTHKRVRLIAYGVCALLFVVLLLLIRWALARGMTLPVPALSRKEWFVSVCVSLLVALLIAAPFGLLIMWLLRERTRKGLRRILSEQGIAICVQCGYDLTGNVSGVCSECGTNVPKQQDHETPSGGLESVKDL